ncbi:TonB-dependent receptor [Hyunsoonleella sp. SJ7]|uniref:TonB-dependent receptor n=1 Tax=Hyunsoonleella aquatilis TaxID=2762758 RepID=A0A923H8M6_9FLAO|nr:TonB-dependent receptor [Hyunsoonleella aquatilis]MBC3758313.1 TonB-dependent receptor [Hyunsoonleella aquatilis]
MKTILKCILLLFCGSVYAQTTISGTVTDDSGQPIPGANIIIVGTSSGTVTDFDGGFTLTSNQNPPFTIQASSVGFESATQEVTSDGQKFDLVLTEGTSLDEVVISASRTPERIFESPVTIERFGLKEIKNTAAAEFYDGLENLKGVDINTNSLTFKSINTRGFATFANTRFMQLVDGMDNAAPLLNFPLGNLLGMIETDVQSVELLPGAASALYGANAFNGILFMRSKNPFDHAGISGYYKYGMTSQEAAGDNQYIDYGIRAAHKFSDKFAAKINFSYLQGTDWVANDTRGKDRTTSIVNPNSTRENDIDYDGVNVYGDLASSNIANVAQILADLGRLPNPALANLVPSVNVSRTGYAESDLTDYDAKSIKADWGLYYRPWGNDFEIQYVGKIGSGATIYQGSNRYQIKDFFLQQHKIEVKNDNFFVRGYITRENAGNSYDMVFTGLNINRKWKSDEQWFGEYTGAFIEGTLAGLTADEAHAQARAVADTGRFEPGTPEFQQAFNTVTSDPDVLTGSQLRDQSKLNHVDANYNFGHLIDWAEIQVGGSYRNYELNSFGSIYTDKLSSIPYSEVGVYTQLQKKFLEDERLKVTASIRYDKSELFDPFFSPRVSFGYNIGDDENHNIRASFQTGFRNPDTQSLYIGFDVGPIILLGGANDNPQRDIRTRSGADISPTGQAILGTNSFTYDATGAYNNSFTRSSVTAFSQSQNPADLQIANPELVKPEQVTSIEVGYRGKVDKVVIDLSAYHNRYKDFITSVDVISPFYGDVQLSETFPVNGTPTPLSVIALANEDFQAYRANTNTTADVSSWGASVGVTTKVFGDFDLGANYTYARLDFDRAANPDFQTNFNTPEHKFKATFGNTDLFKNFGFNVAWRWSDNYVWEATFLTADVPAYHVLDAQINFRVPKIKSQFKAGATNLLGDEYFTAAGTGRIGSQYYVSWIINNL